MVLAYFVFKVSMYIPKVYNICSTALVSRRSKLIFEQMSLQLVHQIQPSKSSPHLTRANFSPRMTGSVERRNHRRKGITIYSSSRDVVWISLCVASTRRAHPPITMLKGFVNALFPQIHTQSNYDFKAKDMKKGLSQSKIEKPDSKHATMGVGERTKKGAPVPGTQTRFPYRCSS